MAKSVHDNVLDAALNYIKSNGDRLFVCTAQPTTYAEAGTASNLATGTIGTGDYTGPADGTTAGTLGRRLKVNEKASVSITATGTASHVGIGYSASSLLLYVTTCTAQALTSGGTVTVPEWWITIADPT